MTSEFFYSSAIYDSKTVSRVHWAIIPSRLWPMTSPYSFLWGGGVISDSVEASSPHGIGQPTLVCSPLSSLPTTADPGLQQPPRGSTLKRFLQMTGFLCSIHKVPLGRGGVGWGVGLDARWAAESVWGKHSTLCRTRAGPEQWSSWGSGGEVICCVAMSCLQHSSQQGDLLESLLYSCSLLKGKICLRHLIKTRPLLLLASHDTGSRASCFQSLAAGTECLWC